ncbi:hypothetical protein SAMN02983003_0707 [Devosia enhydra]|uniref:Uncharacterized protein n=1 Tax=Devosia enhydra TaxID=665118 RepID=A0A1K2HTX9_9HYPH|nr:hypothetical protein [Devosia enhydra]SFZ81814.1 hypothetical protein SAMN02983003_0707 [Devosia enhydra]
MGAQHQPARIELTAKAEAYVEHQRRKAFRARIEACLDEVHAMIEILDRLDGDCDLEPNLGAPEIPPLRLVACNGNLSGWGREQGDQRRWAQGAEDDTEHEDEHGGDIQDEPHDALSEGNDELDLGWSESVVQGCGMCAQGNIERDGDMPGGSLIAAE